MISCTKKTQKNELERDLVNYIKEKNAIPKIHGLEHDLVHEDNLKTKHELRTIWRTTKHKKTSRIKCTKKNAKTKHALPHDLVNEKQQKKRIGTRFGARRKTARFGAQRRPQKDTNCSTIGRTKKNTKEKRNGARFRAR